MHKLSNQDLIELENFEFLIKKRKQFFKDLIWWDIPFWITWVLFTWFYVSPENIRTQVIINIEMSILLCVKYKTGWLIYVNRNST